MIAAVSGIQAFLETLPALIRHLSHMRIPYTSIEVPVRVPAFVRRHPWRWGIGTAVVILFVLPAWALTRPKQPEYVTVVVETKDIEQTVEAVGAVTSEKDLELQFKNAGIVYQVLVKGGQSVRAGQRLATLRAGGLGASVASAQASVAEAEANLRTLVEGTRPEDIAIAEASLQNKKAALEAALQSVRSNEDELAALEREIDVTQASDVVLAPSDINEKITAAQEAISNVQGIMRSNDVQDSISRSSPGNYYTVQQQLNALPTEFTVVISSSAAITDISSAVSAYGALRAALVKTSAVFSQVFSVMALTQPTTYLTQQDITNYKSAINKERSAVQAVITAVDIAMNNLQKTPAALSTRLATAKSALNKAKADALTYESAVRIEQAQLDLKKAGARQTDIDAARARVNYARANLARAAADYGDTQIVAPVDGVITRVAIKAGEVSPVGSAITMQGNSPYRIEMYVSEIDVPKLAVSLTGSIVLDAFRNEKLALRVADIDKRATDKDGVPKYRVKLDFLSPHEDLRIGMTGDAAIVTGSRMGVLSVPRRAVLENSEGKPVVRVLEGSLLVEKSVVTGMEGDSDIEIVSGLKEGETVIVLVKE